MCYMLVEQQQQLISSVRIYTGTVLNVGQPCFGIAQSPVQNQCSCARKTEE